MEAYDILESISRGKVAMPVIEGFPAPTLPWLITLLMLALGAGVAVTVGWNTDKAALVSLMLGVLVLLWDQQTYSSHRLLATLLMTYLIFAKSGTAWSVRPDPGRPSVPWWPQLLMMSQISVVYLFSALSKMNVIFISGGPLAAWVWIELPWQFYTVAAAMTVFVELLIACGLWFPASRRIAVLLGLGLHLSIVTLMNHETFALLTFSLTCISLYPLFLFRPRLREARLATVSGPERSPATSA
ncbi:HTTM domain-containing protein [Agromyces sp. NPDC049794]|uniref:HTTM domain-containing protein n=1 Tax=unclassified Agromyces TaxID=2639701 RepID=UPI0033E3DF0F